MATCWQWLRDRGRTPHQRYQAEEEARRKRLQHKPHLESLEKRGSPGVPVDPAAMLVAGLAGVSIVPQGLFRHDAPAALTGALPVTAPPVATLASRSRAAGVTSDVPLPTDSQRPELASPKPRKVSSAAAPARAGSSSDATSASADAPGSRVYDSATAQWRPLQDIFPATAHLPPDGDSSPPAKPPVPSPNPFIPAPHLPPDLTPDTMPAPPARHIPQTAPTQTSAPTPTNFLAAASSGTAIATTTALTLNAGRQSTLPPIDVAAMQKAAGAVPLRFDANVGQSPSSVRYLAHGQGYTLFLTDNEAVLNLQQLPSNPGPDTIVQGDVLRTSMLGANPTPSITPLDPLSGRSNYFSAGAPGGYKNIIGYGGIEYQDI
ncbi:MAG TPA: hypothetical protein VFA18_04890, partial [Gemmataceae bacterium]|nr:hypothetical protein [Gemmataceae bacterium]